MMMMMMINMMMTMMMMTTMIISTYLISLGSILIAINPLSNVVPAETCSSFLEKFALDIKKEAVSAITGIVVMVMMMMMMMIDMVMVMVVIFFVVIKLSLPTLTID
jgi:hypothetical protein